MDSKRYRPISWKVAIRKVLDGKSVHRFNPSGSRVTFYLNDIDALVEKCEGVGTFINSNGLDNFVGRSGWYLEKEFDVRSEMLLRPEEWVGAFKDKRNGGWFKVGFDTSCMSAVKTKASWTEPARYLDETYDVSPEEIFFCIPIEDVPEEERT